MTFRRAVLATALLLPVAALAQRAPFGGPYAPIVLSLPAGPRSLALGNTGIASRDDEVVFFNPAQIVIARGFAVSAERYSATSAGGALSSVTRFNTGGLAFGMRMVDYDAPLDLFPSDRGSMLNAGPGAATSVEASVGIGQVIKGLRVGGTVKYAEDNTPAARVGRAALDLGVSKDLFRYYTFGLAVQNIGSSMTIPCAIATIPREGDCIIVPLLPGAVAPVQFTAANLPTRTTLGVAASRGIGELDVLATTAVSLLRLDRVLASGGVEVGYSWLDGYSVAFRAGARTPLPGEQSLNAGFGYNMDRLSIDYALEALVGWRAAHRIGLRIR